MEGNGCPSATVAIGIAGLPIPDLGCPLTNGSDCEDCFQAMYYGYDYVLSGDFTVAGTNTACGVADELLVNMGGGTSVTIYVIPISSEYDCSRGNSTITLLIDDICYEGDETVLITSQSATINFGSSGKRVGDFGAFQAVFTR
jgi:hypothetical protein